QASASSRAPRPKASAAPEITSGMACSGFTAERGKTGDATSPRDRVSRPSASAIAIAPRWRLSMASPRVTSTSTGFVIDSASMKQAVHRLHISTGGRGLVEITDEVVRWVEAQALTTGLLTLFCRHTSASLL